MAEWGAHHYNPQVGAADEGAVVADDVGASRQRVCEQRGASLMLETGEKVTHLSHVASAAISFLISSISSSMASRFMIFRATSRLARLSNLGTVRHQCALCWCLPLVHLAECTAPHLRAAVIEILEALLCARQLSGTSEHGDAR